MGGTENILLRAPRAKCRRDVNLRGELLGVEKLVQRSTTKQIVVVFAVKSLERVAEICKKAHEAALASAKLISQGQSVVSAKPTTMPQTPRPRGTPIDLLMSAFYCKYCRWVLSPSVMIPIEVLC